MKKKIQNVGLQCCYLIPFVFDSTIQTGLPMAFHVDVMEFERVGMRSVGCVCCSWNRVSKWACESHHVCLPLIFSANMISYLRESAWSDVFCWLYCSKTCKGRRIHHLISLSPPRLFSSHTNWQICSKSAWCDHVNMPQEGFKTPKVKSVLWRVWAVLGSTECV